MTGDETIVVVEDHPEILELVTGLLQERGYRVLGSTDSQEDLAMLRNDPGPIQLLITDLSLPGTSGASLRRKRGKSVATSE